MLLQALREYAETRLKLPPAMYQTQAIRYVIVLDDDGGYLDRIDTADASSKLTKSGSRFAAPHIKRTVGIRPKVLADTGAYVLGLLGEDAKPERVRQQHEAFVALVDHCAETTGEPAVRAVAAFLHGEDSGSDRVSAGLEPAAQIMFRVGDCHPIDLPTVRTYWAAVRSPDDDDASGARFPCIVCGRSAPALERHPFKIKGIPGGQILKDLISANAPAFESYGLTASLTAPTCQTCAEAYGNALNALLSDATSRLWMGGVAYAFWTKRDSPFKPASMFSDPEGNKDEVAQLLRSHRTGKVAATEIDATAFYAVSLGASGARVVVRDWIETTVGEAKRRLGRYFALQTLVDAYGEPGLPLPMGRIANATVRDPRKESPPALVPSALARLALHGDPLPLDLLYLAVRRNRAEQDVNRERALLIKMTLGSQPEFAGREETVMSDLDSANTEPAYLCGRLLAVLDTVQQRAMGNPNATIVDKFYGSASSAPASVFGTLLHGAQAHLGKIRKDQRGTSIALEARLEAVMEPLAAFPPTLTLQEQGLFALGFYHERAANRRAARERREERERAKDDPAAAETPAAE